MAHEVSEKTDELVKALQARVRELESNLETLRLRLAGMERTLSSIATLDGPAFERAAREAYDRLNQTQRGFVGVVPISDLRRSLGARVPREAFEAHLVRLHDERVIELMAPPGTPSDERQREGLVHPTLGNVYYLRWERRG
jgi:hypothetical protein